MIAMAGVGKPEREIVVEPLTVPEREPVEQPAPKEPLVPVP